MFYIFKLSEVISCHKTNILYKVFLLLLNIKVSGLWNNYIVIYSLKVVSNCGVIFSSYNSLTIICKIKLC